MHPHDWWNDCMIHDILWLASSSFDCLENIDFHWNKKRMTDRPTDRLTLWKRCGEASEDILWPFYGFSWVSVVEKYLVLLFLQNASTTDRPTDRPTDEQTDPNTDMGGGIEKDALWVSPHYLRPSGHSPSLYVPGSHFPAFRNCMLFFSSFAFFMKFFSVYTVINLLS